MNMATLQGPTGELRFERQMIEVTSLSPRPDKKWHYIDRNGHEHIWQDGWPTLTWIIDETYHDEDLDEDYSTGHWECSQCNEAIEPGMVGPSDFREFAPGRGQWFFNGRPIDPEEAEEIRRGWGAQGR